MIESISPCGDARASLGLTYPYLGMTIGRMDTTSTRRAVAAEVRAAIARAGLHPTAVADKAGISRTTFRRRISGQSPLTIDELVAIANALDVDVSTFLTPALTAAA